ncbi:MAG: hypothetical protein ACKVTZ_14365 [Bacteroidia bacterium]
MRTFGSFTFDVVEKQFNIQEVKNLPLLLEWLSASYQENEYKTYQLNDLKEELADKARIWNEDELKMFFIGPLIKSVNLSTKDFQPFTQRLFSFKTEVEEIGGRIDFLIAKGRRVPELPFFCIHEYKQETDKEGDPLGQLLIAMVAAQKLNEKNMPILGAYVVGRNWFFVVLAENEYSLSKEYDASSEDIFQIFAILQKSKELIQRFIS